MPHALGLRLTISINPNLIDKNVGGDRSHFTRGWENREPTVEELLAEVTAGRAYCAQLSGPRKTANFLACNLVSVDIDGTRTIEDVLSDAIVARNATFMYTTPSHTPEVPRLRVGFALPRTIINPKEMSSVMRSLALRLAGDARATDAARISFGSRGAQTWLLGNEIDLPLFEELIAQNLEPPASDSATGGAAGRAAARSDLTLSPDQKVTLQDGRMVPFSEVEVKTRLHCPFHRDRNPSAFVVSNKRGVKGLHCSTCGLTYWPPYAGGYDFYDFDEQVRRAVQYFEEHRDWGPLFLDFPRSSMSDVTAHVVRGHPAPGSLAPGLTFIKSPKGSGKTEALKRLLSRSSKVLLIGHRRSLIRQICRRLGLGCYLDDDCFSFGGIPVNQDRYGVCLDSLGIILPTTRYDVIVLDESEQVLAHFLSETIEHQNGGGRERLFVIFAQLLSRAKHVIALDADLSWPTFRTITRLATHDRRSGRISRKQVNVWLNEDVPKTGKKIQVYASEAQLIAELRQDVADGKRCFVTSNSRAKVETISSIIANADLDRTIKQLVITASTVNGEEQKAFIAAPRTEAPKYDVILTSPALGTGVDISFPGDVHSIDVVFGFFEPLITTHFDCDQQLGRVRKPRAVKVWISPRRYQFETDLAVVKKDIMVQSLFKNVLSGFDDNDQPVYDEEDPFIEMAALIVSQQRASKNNLKGNFVEYKKRQDFEVDQVVADDEARAVGSELLKFGRAFRDEDLANKLLAAAPLKRAAFIDIRRRFEANYAVSQLEWLSYERTRLELFYRRPLSRQLITLDDRGKYRSKVKVFELMTHPLLGLSHQPARVFEEKRARFVKSVGDTARSAIAVLGQTPLMRQGQFDLAMAISMHDLKPFVQFVRERKAAVENLLGTEVRADLAKKPTQQLGAVLKLIGLKLVDAGTRSNGGDKTYLYRLDDQALARVQAIVEARRAARGWQAVYDMHGWPPDWSDEKEQGDRDDD